MKLELKNIGLIKECSIEINAITVIAGSNNTGKSTIGKSLYTIFNSAYKIENKIKNERESALFRLFISSTGNYDHDFEYSKIDSIVEELIKNKEKYLSNNELLQKKLIDFNPKDSSITEKNLINNIIDILKLNNDELMNYIFSKRLINDFEGDITNIYSKDDGFIKLSIKNQDIEINIKDRNKTNLNFPKDLSLQTEIIYIDNPFVLDMINRRSARYTSTFNNRSRLLIHKLTEENEGNTFEQLLADRKIEKIENIINDVCEGNIVEEDGKYFYKQGNESLGISNLSAGLKAFVIIKMLLLSGAISYNGTIILDEPEIHLHPEWQIKYAELIVLLQKEFNLHILINTHSPYFMDALYIFSKKYRISDKNKYYLTSVENMQSSLIDVTDKEEEIYKKLAKPFQDLENYRSEIDD